MSLLFVVQICRPNTMAHKHLRMSQVLRLSVRLCNAAGLALVNRPISTNARSTLHATGWGGNDEQRTRRLKLPVFEEHLAQRDEVAQKEIDPRAGVRTMYTERGRSDLRGAKTHRPPRT